MMTFNSTNPTDQPLLIKMKIMNGDLHLVQSMVIMYQNRRRYFKSKMLFKLHYNKTTVGYKFKFKF